MFLVNLLHCGFLFLKVKGQISWKRGKKKLYMQNRYLYPIMHHKELMDYSRGLIDLGPPEQCHKTIRGHTE